MNRQQSVVVGTILIALGVVSWLNLWGLIWPGMLFAVGGVAYVQRRRIGRTVEAVQSGLWLAGLGLLFLLSFVFPGILLLAGASILIRGREQQIDDQIQAFLASLGTNARSSSRSNLPSQRVPVTTVPSTPTASETEVPTTGETTRL